MLMFFLLYTILMLCCLALFIVLNQKHKWVTKDFYLYDDGGKVVATIFLILFYPISILIGLGTLVWQKYIPDR